jgi:hypothetical protein
VTEAKRGAIIAIHGVGTPEPGEIITELSTLFPDTAYVRNDIVVSGTSFARLEAQNELRPDLLEMNWSDIKRPPRSVLGVIEWTIALSLALARSNLSWSHIRLRTGQMHAFFSETVLLWITYPVLLGFMHSNLSSYALAVGDAAILLMAALTYWMVRRMTRMSAISGICALALMPLLALILWRWPRWYSVIEPVAIRAYGLAQVVAAVLITLMVSRKSCRQSPAQADQMGPNRQYSWLGSKSCRALSACRSWRFGRMFHNRTRRRTRTLYSFLRTTSFRIDCRPCPARERWRGSLRQFCRT